MKIRTLLWSFAGLTLWSGCAANESIALTTPQHIVHATSQVDAIFPQADAQALSFLLNSTENTIYSPLSYHYAMGMLTDCLDGTSKKEIEAYYQQDAATLMERLMMAADAYDEKDSITMSNSLWMQEDADVNKETLQSISDHYRASTFSIKLPDEQDNIKEFVKQQTDGKIEPEIQTSKDTMLLLVNTLALEDTWITPFTKGEDGIFHSTTDLQTSYLSSTLEMPAYAETDTFQIADVYLNQGSRLRIALPKEQNIDVTSEELQSLMNMKLESLDMTKLYLKIPPFKFRQHHDLNELTKRLGMKGIFENPADLVKLGDGLVVSSIIQDAMIDVNEHGLSAAASTVVDISKTSLPIEGLEWEEITMTADHPFLFFVMDDMDNVMFAGKVHNPGN